MTENKRILLNVIATYGRSLYALMIGLFTARWVLQALGQQDYGLYGVVGGLTGFISFFNSLLAGAVSRFYAVSIGKARVAVDKESELADCRRWFSTAVFVHVTVPTALVMVGYPIGIWVVENFLTIPSDRISDCVWVFRCVCVSCYLGMVSVPFNAMYNAKQYIAELTVYSFVTTTANAGALYYMVSHPGVWLARYAFWACLLTILPQFVIAIRAIYLFPECRLDLSSMASLRRIRQLMYFAGCWAFGVLGGLLRGQGLQILINKYFGPKVNAAMTLANSVNGHTMTLSAAMVGAFQPAIVTAYGAGDWNRMRMLAFRSSKFSVMALLAFMLPLGLELDYVLRIWLVTPPEYVYGLTLIMFGVTLIDQSTIGQMTATNSTEKIAKYNILAGGALISVLPVAWFLCAMGLGVYSVGWAMFASVVLCAAGRLWFARRLVGMSVIRWLNSIVLPCLIVGIVVVLGQQVIRFYMPCTMFRFLLSVFVCEIIYLPLAWFAVFDMQERSYMRERVMRLMHLR